jgi:ammonia channel protein AmtB
MQLYSNGNSPTIAALVQINMWLAVAGSIVGVFTANAITYRKINVHDVIFVSLAGAISFSSSSTINYNPGAAIAIGSGVGFICALIHTPFKRWMNDGGVRETNSVIVQFIIPGAFAVIFSSILQAINQGSFNITVNSVNQTKMNMD